MASNERPNILWISLEDTSPRFGCYGDPVARTPNLDRLAAEGCRYPNAFSTAGVCAPSRCAIITGMYQNSIGGQHMRTTHQNRYTPEMPTPYSAVPPHYVKTFTEYLRASGYYCTNCKKTDYQFTPPLTAWDELGDEAHWRNRPEGMPFFSVFNPTRTHESGMWPKENENIQTDPDAVSLPPYLPDTPKARLALARHYDNLAWSDTYVGSILQQLEDDGLADNTIVFIWSDHGEGLPRAKRWPYDAGIRIPCIIRWPGVLEPGSVNERLVNLVDLGPTVLSLCGVPVPAHMHGRPFVGPHEQPREYVFATRDRYDEAYDMVRSVRDSRYKYIRNYFPNQPYLLWIPYRNRHPVVQEMWRLHAAGELTEEQSVMFQCPRPPEELYDTENDPFELNNLAADPGQARTLERMRAALDAWRHEIGDLGDIPECEMKARWHVGGEKPKTAAPVFIPIDENHPGQGPPEEDEVFTAPLLVQMHCATQGASITYTTDEGENPWWRLYTEPLRLTETRMVRARAVRIGYEDSNEVSFTFRV